MSEKTIQTVKKEHTSELMSIPGVVGVGIGKCGDDLCIRVMVSKKTTRLEKRIPSSIESYRVDVVETGSFIARPAKDVM